MTLIGSKKLILITVKNSKADGWRKRGRRTFWEADQFDPPTKKSIGPSILIQLPKFITSMKKPSFHYDCFEF